MLHEVLSIYSIEFWFELAIAIRISDINIWIFGNMDICFSQKCTLISRLREGGKGQDLDVRSIFRTEFLFCQWPLMEKQKTLACSFWISQNVNWES